MVIKQLVLQYVIVRPTLAVASVAMVILGIFLKFSFFYFILFFFFSKKIDVFGEGQFTPKKGYFYVSIIQNISGFFYFFIFFLFFYFFYFFIFIFFFLYFFVFIFCVQFWFLFIASFCFIFVLKMSWIVGKQLPNSFQSSLFCFFHSGNQ